jgi:hypothetical protein
MIPETLFQEANGFFHHARIPAVAEQFSGTYSNAAYYTRGMNPVFFTTRSIQLL